MVKQVARRERIQNVRVHDSNDKEAPISDGVSHGTPVVAVSLPMTAKVVSVESSKGDRSLFFGQISCRLGTARQKQEGKDGDKESGQAVYQEEHPPVTRMRFRSHLYQKERTSLQSTDA